MTNQKLKIRYYRTLLAPVSLIGLGSFRKSGTFGNYWKQTGTTFRHTRTSFWPSRFPLLYQFSPVPKISGGSLV